MNSKLEHGYECECRRCRNCEPALVPLDSRECGSRAAIMLLVIAYAVSMWLIAAVAAWMGR
jgi:hypothetical protein